MVVLYVTPYLRRKGENPKGGGLEAYLFRVAGALKEFGHTPIILSLGKRDMHYVEEGIEICFVNCPYIQLGSGKIGFLWDRIYQSMVINRKVAELLHERKIDIIQFPQTFGIAACYYGKTPAVMRLSSYSKETYKDYLSKTELNIRAFCERFAARRCNAVFAPSNYIANAFSKDIHRPVSVMESPFWNDVQAYDHSVYNEKLSGKKYILFIGRLAVEKGVLVMAESIPCFLKEHPEYYFVCCGDNDVINGKSSVRILREAMGRYQEKFIYIETLSHDALYPVIGHADFVICPSLRENFSNACMEAMYFGRVVIGTDGTSYEQLIDDGKSGLLCMPGNAKSLLNKMNEAASMSETEKAEIGKYARKRIDKQAPKYTVSKLLRFYQYVIDSCNQI